MSFVDELALYGVLGSSLGRKRLDTEFEEPPRGYEILRTGSTREWAGAKASAPIGGKSDGRRQAPAEASRLRRGRTRHGAERPQDARLHDLHHRRSPD